MAKADKTEHVLVPEHFKLSDKEAKDVLKKYNVTFKEMPKILITDPAIQHLNPAESDIIKIERKSRTAGKMTFYRAVIKD
jgi:DNA-directed RNA polymerase subunit H (RpoH/RPB5)